MNCATTEVAPCEKPACIAAVGAIPHWLCTIRDSAFPDCAAAAFRRLVILCFILPFCACHPVLSALCRQCRFGLPSPPCCPGGIVLFALRLLSCLAAAVFQPYSCVRLLPRRYRFVCCCFRPYRACCPVCAPSCICRRVPPGTGFWRRVKKMGGKICFSHCIFAIFVISK